MLCAVAVTRQRGATTFSRARSVPPKPDLDVRASCDVYSFYCVRSCIVCTFARCVCEWISVVGRLFVPPLPENSRATLIAHSTGYKDIVFADDDANDVIITYQPHISVYLHKNGPHTCTVCESVSHTFSHNPHVVESDVLNLPSTSTKKRIRRWRVWRIIRTHACLWV